MQDPTNTTQPERAGINHPGFRRKGSVATFETATGERAQPVIQTEHLPEPEAAPPYWKAKAQADARAAEFLDRAAQEQSKAKEIQRAVDVKLRRLSAIDHTVASKAKELNSLRQSLADLDPAKLKARFEMAYFRSRNFAGDRAEREQWFEVASLMANSKTLGRLLQDKVSEAENEIATLEAEKSQIEKELADEA